MAIGGMDLMIEIFLAVAIKENATSSFLLLFLLYMINFGCFSCLRSILFIICSHISRRLCLGHIFDDGVVHG